MLLHVREHVAVGVQRDNDIGVAQHLGDYLGVDVPAEKESSACVPEVTEMYLRKT